MYLERALLLNSGPTERCSVELSCHEDGRPKPVVIVGGNGSGKTNFLSVVADGLMELAASRYVDVLPARSIGHSYYRVAGGRTRLAGAQYDLAALRFRHEDKFFYFFNHTGEVPLKELDVELREFGGSSATNHFDQPKRVEADRSLVEAAFRNDVYAYFPCSRYEVPHWQNDETLDKDPPADMRARMADRLDKSIVLQRGLSLLKPWIIDLILDQSVDSLTALSFLGRGTPTTLPPQLTSALSMIQSLQDLNKIIQTILSRPDARLVRTNRTFRDRRIQIAFGDQSTLPVLDCLSAGQSTLLSIFGNTFRLGTETQAPATAASASGIVLVDEIDAHLHADLQYEAVRCFQRFNLSSLATRRSCLLGWRNALARMDSN